MARKPEEFQKAVAEHHIKKWSLRNCPICNDPIGYEFFDNDTLIFDSGCSCIITPNTRDASWQDVAYSYNLQANPELINRMDIFFHFITPGKY